MRVAPMLALVSHLVGSNALGDSIGGHIADGCTFLLTAYEMYPERHIDGPRTLWKPRNDVCGFPRPAYFFSATNDLAAAHTLAAPGSKYHVSQCTATYPWVSSLLQQIRQRFGTAKWSVVDVGTNIGQETIISAINSFPVLSFEPFPDNVNTARLNAAINCVHDIVTIVNAAADATIGETCIAVREGSGHAGTNVHVGQKATGSHARCINVTTIDATLEQPQLADFAARRPALVKIDCEGNEVKSMQGATEMFDRMKPLVVLYEWAGRRRAPPHSPGGFLYERGYRMYSTTGGDSFVDTPFDQSKSLPWQDHLGRTTTGAVDIYAVHVPTFMKPKFAGFLDADRLLQLNATL